MIISTAVPLFIYVIFKSDARDFEVQALQDVWDLLRRCLDKTACMRYNRQRRLAEPGFCQKTTVTSSSLLFR